MQRLRRLSTGILVLALLAPALAACDLLPTSQTVPTSTPSRDPTTFRPFPPPTSLAILDTSVTPSPAIPLAPTVAGSVVISPPANDPTSQMDSYLSGLAGEGPFSGSVLVARDGKVLLDKGYGMADWENDIPNTPQTKFRIASLTKQFTATAIMLLQQDGELSVDDSVCRFVSDCPAIWKPMLIRHLLTHTSGLPPDLPMSDVFSLMTSLQPVREGLNLYKKRPLQSEPGKAFQYSNAGYDLLGYIIEQASGKRYEAYLRERILTPLGMANTGQDHDALLIKRRATGYSAPTARAPYLPVELAYSAGGLYSTVEDLYRWDQALYTEQVLPKSALDKMFTPNLNNYGYGWTIETGPWGKVLTHNGNIPGFVSSISRYPGSKVVIIVLSNLSTSPIDRIPGELAGRVFGGK